MADVTIDPSLYRIRSSVSRQSIVPYEPVSTALRGPTDNLVLNSMSGADVTCSVVVPRPAGWKEYLQASGLSEAEYDLPILKVWAEIETISISSARSVFPVRRLGEHHVHEYTRGSRSVAGSLIFTTFNRDVFADLYRAWPGESFYGADRNPPMHVDQMPPFHIFLHGTTEYGTIAQAALINVSLTNFGTTFSIHDLKSESTYSYVAQFFYPWVQNTRDFQTMVKRAVALDATERLSDVVQQRDGQYQPRAVQDFNRSFQGLDPEDRRVFLDYVDKKLGGK